MKQEDWEESILNSLEGIKRAQAPAGMYARIHAAIQAPAMRTYSRVSLLTAAAGLALLVSANIWALQTAASENTDASSLFQVENADFNLYENHWK